MKKEDFIFTVGYQGATALVDKSNKGKYARMSLEQLIEKGLLKPALCWYIWEREAGDVEKTELGKHERVLIDAVNKAEGASFETISQIERLFGVFRVPEGVNRITYL
jgi:hypothetical protein